MSDTRAADMASKMRQFLLAYGPDRLQLVIWVMRQLAKGYPLSAEQVDRHIAELGIAADAAHQFLREVAERNATDQIVGVMGLSLSDHPHRLSVQGVPLSAWCALDTLFLPTVLGQIANIESQSPATHETIRLRVSPDRVEDVDPTDAVVTIVLVDPDRENMASVEAIWGAFCHHIHFFATRDEAERWTKGRGNIAILTVDEAFAWGRQMWSGVISIAA